MRYPNSAKKLLCVSVLAAMGFSAQVAAQDTSSAIRGRLLDANGNPMSNATVEVRDSRTGAVRTLQSNASGAFLANNLPVGGPYVITINNTKTVTVDNINLGDTYNLNVTMEQASQIEEIIVLGGLNSLVDVAAGPSATFGAFDLSTSVTYERDIKDIYTIDPRFNLDGDSQINCVGKHPRFNSITLDGISQNDRFGLNNNGYATATGQPFPYDAIAQVSAELAPFDVTYGGFSACNVNAVTKSGTNEWTGSAYYEYTGDSLRGDTLTDNSGRVQNFALQDYKEERYGFSVGGPLIEDTLFIFGAYEEFEEPRFLAQGFDGSGNGVERPWLSQDDFNRVNDISNNLYSYNPGGQPTDGAQTEEKLLIRADWNINEDHTLAVIYNSYEGIQSRSSDGDFNEFEFANHFYDKGADLETWQAKLQSQWTDAFSTEVIIATNEMIDSQVTVGPKDFGDHQIELGNNTIYLGADDSRQANQLNWESTFYRFAGQYLVNDHVLSFGFERDELEVFNQFVQHSRGGEWDYFDDSDDNPASCAALTAQGRLDDPLCSLSGIDKFELGRPDFVFYGSGGGTNNANDAAASYDLNLNSLYVQDEWYLPQYNLTLVGGLRYEWYDQDARPTFNENFFLNSGVRNDANLDGVDLLMPRLGFTWEAMDQLTVRGGIGLYGGGNPNVWISNAWSNDGITNAQFRLANRGVNSVFDGSLPLSGQGRPGYDVPQSMVDDVAAVSVSDGSTRRLALIDPDYEQPSEWKYVLGATYTFDSGMTVDGDLLYSRQVDPVATFDISQEIVGSTLAGNPIYDYVRGEDNFMLTNNDFDEGRAFTASLVARHQYDWGLDWLLGYAYTRATDVSPMTSFTAGSNYTNVAAVDGFRLAASNSNYVTPHRFTARVSYGKEFIPGHETRITAMLYRNQGQPATHVLDAQDGVLEGDRSRRVPLYIPRPNDPNVVPGPNFDVQAFSNFIEEYGYAKYAGGFIPRNGEFSEWSTRMDLRIDQELPLLFGTRARAYLKIYNVLNLIDDNWGLQNDAQFFSVDVVDASVDAQGRLVYERFSPRSLTDLREQLSLYEIRLGVQFEF